MRSMELTLKRIALRPTYTIGRLFIDGKYFCDTLEDTVRDLNKNGRFDGNEKKIPGETAIPYGRYVVTMCVVSPRFASSPTYASIGGKLPRLLGVPHFDGILIHIGNTAKDSSGCILCGKNTIVGQLTESKVTFFKLYPILKAAEDRGEQIHITIE